VDGGWGVKPAAVEAARGKYIVALFSGVCVKLALFLAGALLLCGLVRLWRGLSLPTLAGYGLLVLGYFAVPLCTPALQVPTDIAYQWRPWSAALPAPVRPRNPLLADVPLQMLPFHDLVRKRLLAGEMPLWASELGTGQPLLGNAQSAPFAPLHLMALPLPPLQALTVAVAWQVLVALLLMHALLEALGAGRAGAAFGAVAYALSVFEICWAYHPHGMAMAWIPGVLLSIVLVRRGEAGGMAGLVACGLGLLLSGHPETAATAALVSLVAAGVLAARPGGVSRRAFVLELGLAAGLTACLAAPVLLPVLDAIPESARQAMVSRRADLVQPPPFESRLLALIVDPLRFGSPRDDTWRGPFNFNELCSGYAGLLPLAVACAGAMLRPRRILPILAGGCLALLVALRIDPFFTLATRLPAIGATPHARLRLVFVLAVALAGGLGLDVLDRRRGRLALGACGLALSLALLLLPPPPQVWEQTWYLLTLAGALAWSGAIFVVKGTQAVRWLAVVALLADLVSLNVRYQPVVSPRFALTPPPPAVAYLAAQRGAAAAPFRVMGEYDALKPNLGALYGLWDPRGNDPIQPARAAFIVGRSMRPRFEVGREVWLSPPAFRQPLFDFLGLRFLLLRHRERLPPPWVPVWEEPGSRIWRNDAAFGLFFVPRSVLAVKDPVQATLACDDLQAVAFVGSGEASRQRQEGSVAMVRAEPNGFVVDVATSSGGLLASSVALVRGWRARTEKGEAAVREVDGGFLGVELGPGRHLLRLTYEPPHWRLALLLFGLGILMAAGLTCLRMAGVRGGVPRH
jgi:Bacterial membrane protein YfhO